MIIGGADGDRTHDLMNAIHALSQLSYSPRIEFLKNLTQKKKNCQFNLFFFALPQFFNDRGLNPVRKDGALTPPFL
jgi:hypothetical protein